MKWFVYTRGTIHLHRAAQVLLGVSEFATKLGVVNLENVLYINEGSKLWWAWFEKEIRNLGRKIIKKCSVQSEEKKHFKKLKKYVRQAISAAEKTRKMNLKKKSNIELVQLYNFFYEKALPAHGLMDTDIDAIDVVFEDFLQNKIKKGFGAKIGSVNFLNLYKDLSMPAYQSYLAEQEEEVIKFAIKKDFSFSAAKNLYEKFWWTKLGWENMRPYAVSDFIRMIKKYAKQKDLKNRLKEVDGYLKKIKEKREAILKKYEFSPEIRYWLKVLDDYTYLHDLRKEMQVRTTYSFYLLMSEAARRLKLKKDDLEWLWYDEIKGLLLGKKFDKREVERRKKAICVRVSKNGIKTWSGRAAISQHKKLLPEEKRGVKEFKGVGVTFGKVRARVKVCAGAEEAFKKVKRGEILVCGMTLPDYVPVMKRAAAIITDEGGITCHAAIMARELGIPCVIGTKIATKVLKDGDLVEVNASDGIVKKI